MQGILQEERAGYRWLRIGFATDRASLLLKSAAALTLIILGIWLYLEIPETRLRGACFVLIYLLSAGLYLNLGVWIHEQLHGLAVRGTVHARQAQITYERKHVLLLSGYYRVRGGLTYAIASRGLLGPLWLSLGLLLAGCLGSLFLPGWWLPLMLSLLVVSLLDMIHDFYMYLQIRLIGSKAKYWDRGKVLEVVWKA